MNESIKEIIIADNCRIFRNGEQYYLKCLMYNPTVIDYSNPLDTNNIKNTVAKELTLYLTKDQLKYLANTIDEFIV